MIGRVLIVASVISMVGAPAFAATEYWVGKDAKTHKCAVMNTKPDGKKMTDAGSKMYASKDNAAKAMKMLTACK